MKCPHERDVGDPPQLASCPTYRRCPCADEVTDWLMAPITAVKPAELLWWEEHGDL